MRQRDLIPFFSMAFLIAWGILALYIFASEPMVRLFGSLTGDHPLFYLAVYAPAIAALSLPAVAGRHLGGVASSSLSAQQHTPRRLVANAIFRWYRCPQCHCHTAVQPLTRQHPASCAFPPAGDQSSVARCTALRYLVIRGGCGRRCVDQPVCDVHAPERRNGCDPGRKKGGRK